jgi:hypothetical protein
MAYVIMFLVGVAVGAGAMAYVAKLKAKADKAPRGPLPPAATPKV